MKRNLTGNFGAVCGFVVSMTMAVFAKSAFSSAVAAPLVAAQARQAASSFSHLKTGFPLTGAHTTAACETCHMGGIFKGTPKGSDREYAGPVYQHESRFQQIKNSRPQTN